jgi:membrane protease YdiL (CAAX protease family)
MMQSDSGEQNRAITNDRARRYAIGILLFLLTEILARIIILPSHPGTHDVWKSLLLEWVMFLFLLLVWVPRVEQEDLQSIGVTRFRVKYIVQGVAAYVLAFIPIAIIGSLLSSSNLPTLQSLQELLSAYSLPVLIALVFTGVVLEELLYRGYLIERISRIGGRDWPAFLVSFLAFTLVHWRFVGFYPMLQISVMSAALVILYARERSVWPCSIMHAINSLLAYILFPLAFS